MKLTSADHQVLDNYIDQVLIAYKEGKLDLSQARHDLAQAITAAAIGNEDVFNKHIRYSVKDRWDS
jgi:hypothetical protein